MRWRGRIGAMVLLAVVSLSAGLDGRSVPGTSYVDWKLGDPQDGTTTTPTPTEAPAGDGDPVTTHIERDKQAANVDSTTTEGKDAATTVTPNAPPTLAPGMGEAVEVDRSGVPGTSYIDRDKNSAAEEAEVATTEVSSTSLPDEVTEENRVGVPPTSYIDREKETAKPDSNAAPDIVFPVFDEHINHAIVNNEGHAVKNPTSHLSKGDEYFSGKGKFGMAPSKKKPTYTKFGETWKEEKGGDKIKMTKSKRSITEPKRKTKKSNSELLNHLGLRKLKMPAVNHHRKRLASQSRKAHRQASSADSKMFVIKLPPEPYYYAHHDENETKKKPVNTVPVSFSSNGKPSRVYHWNIPVVKAMVARKAGSSKAAVFTDSDVFNIDKQATWNDSGDEKPYHRKTAFYAPKKAKKEAFRKYFSGNGKPHSFYVMGKSKTPVSTYRLIP